MHWCPSCKNEYREEYSSCLECGTNLIENLDKEPVEYDKEVFLINLKDSIEADIVESLLNSNGIPTLKKHRESGGYMSIYMGNSIFGVDIFVPSKLYEQAEQIINLSKIEDKEINEEMNYHMTEDYLENIDLEEELLNHKGKIDKKRKLRSWLLLLTPVLMWLIISIIRKYV